MKIFIVFAVLLLSVSCGKKESKGQGPRPPQIPPFDDTLLIKSIQEYTDIFEEDYLYYKNIENRNLYGYDYSGLNKVATRFQSQPIVFTVADLSSMGEGVAGVCWYMGNGTRNIQYDRDWYSSLSELQRKQIVYHENGHCQLSRDHRCSAVNAGGDIFSIMYPIIQSNEELSESLGLGGYFDTVLNYLELELFLKSNQNTDDCSPAKSDIANENGDVAHPFYGRVF